MENIWLDLKFTLRVLRKHRAFTVMAILVLAIGIGANTAIFSIINGLLLQSLPYRSPASLVWIWSTHKTRDRAVFSIPDYLDYQRANHSLIEMAAFSNWGANLNGYGEPQRLQGIKVSGNLLPMLGVEAYIGRILTAEDDRPGNQRVVLLGYQLWQQFGGDRAIVGRSLLLNGESYQVVGILPESFLFPVNDAGFIVPLALEVDARKDRRGDNFLRVIARLNDGSTLAKAQSELVGIAEQLQQQYPTTNSGKIAVKIVPLADELIGGYRSSLWMLSIAVALVLLIGCFNLANLILARASARGSELAIRTALGASRGRLIGQLLTENLTLALAGGLVGILMASWSLPALIALAPADLLRVQSIVIDLRVLIFAMIISLLTGIIIGIFPAFQSSQVDLNEALKEQSRSATGNRSIAHSRQLLLIFEVAISLVLLIGAGLFIKSFLQLLKIEPGFNPENLLIMRLSLPKNSYAQLDQISRFSQQVSIEAKALPGIESTAAISVLPLSGLIAKTDFTIPEQAEITGNASKERLAANYRYCSAGYFQVMNIAILRGREFDQHDRADARAVAVISSTLAKRYWADENPIGKLLRLDDNSRGPRDIEIIGIVGDVKQQSLESEGSADIYLPIAQTPDEAVNYLSNNIFLIARTDRQLLTLKSSFQRLIMSIDRNIPTTNINTMSELLAASIAARRFNLLMVSIFAIAALLLAISGLYGVISFAVAQRAHEIGIRIALGATPRQLMLMIMRDGFKSVLIGIVIGSIGAIIMVRSISSLLFNVVALDAMIFIATPLLLMLISIIAIYLPARRAMKINPIEVLRQG